MTTISIIGSGNMASAIGARAAKDGHTIEVMSRDTAKAQALADEIGNGATVGTFGTTPLGDIVIVAVPYASAVPVVANYGDALAARSSSTSPTPSTPTPPGWSPLTAFPARRRSPRPSRRARTS